MFRSFPRKRESRSFFSLALDPRVREGERDEGAAMDRELRKQGTGVK
jgi:hypothetical protein